MKFEISKNRLSPLVLALVLHTPQSSSQPLFFSHIFPDHSNIHPPLRAFIPLTSRFEDRNARTRLYSCLKKHSKARLSMADTPSSSRQLYDLAAQRAFVAGQIRKLRERLRRKTLRRAMVL